MKITDLVRSLSFASALAFSSFTFAADPGVNASENDIAIKGYDAVAYFNQGKPAKGKSKYTTTYKGAIYKFSSATNRDAFKANPTQYAPQYGGFCAMGVAMGKKFDTDPTAWKIVENKLYLNLNKDVQAKWSTDIPGYLVTSERNWNGIEFVSASVLADE